MKAPNLAGIFGLPVMGPLRTLDFLKINQSAKVRTFNRVETLNLFVTRTKAYSNSDVVLTAPVQKHLSPEEYHTQAFKQEELPGAAVCILP